MVTILELQDSISSWTCIIMPSTPSSSSKKCPLVDPTATTKHVASPSILPYSCVPSEKAALLVLQWMHVLGGVLVTKSAHGTPCQAQCPPRHEVRMNNAHTHLPPYQDRVCLLASVENRMHESKNKNFVGPSRQMMRRLRPCRLSANGG